jgi:hypothetical protein
MASTYLGKPYYPAWLDNLADDVTGRRTCATAQGGGQGCGRNQGRFPTASRVHMV